MVCVELVSRLSILCRTNKGQRATIPHLFLSFFFSFSSCVEWNFEKFLLCSCILFTSWFEMEFLHSSSYQSWMFGCKVRLETVLGLQLQAVGLCRGDICLAGCTAIFVSGEGCGWRTRKASCHGCAAHHGNNEDGSY